MDGRARLSTLNTLFVRGGVALLIALAVCLALLPKAVWAAGGEPATVKPEVNAGYAIVQCDQDTIIDVTDVSTSTKLLVNATNEDCVITLKGEAGMTYPIEVTFGYYQGSNSGVGELPSKIVLDNFRTSRSIEAAYYGSDSDKPTYGEESTVAITYSGTSGAKSIQAGHINKFDQELGIGLSLAPATEGSALFVDGSIKSNTNLTISGGAVQAYEIAAGKKLSISDSAVTMQAGSSTYDRTIHADVVEIEGSTLSNVETIYGFSGISDVDDKATLDDSSIRIKDSTVTMQHDSSYRSDQPSGIVHAKAITIEGSKVNYASSYRDVCLGRMFLELEIKGSTITGAVTTYENYPSIGLDSWSWHEWTARGEQVPKIVIDDSEVSARAGGNGAAIGYGYTAYDLYPPLSIEIKNESDVTAITQKGAGIGSGAVYGEIEAGALTISIEDSTVNASSVNGAGIGAGFCKVETGVPTSITISGTSDVTAVSQYGAGIGAGQLDTSNPTDGIPIDFTAGIGGWGDGADQEGDATAVGSADATRSGGVATLAVGDEAGLGPNTGTLTIVANEAGESPVVKAESGVKAVSLTVKADAPMMEYTLTNDNDVPSVTTPINRATEGTVDNGPGAPSYTLRSGFRSLAFWPVAAGAYELSYGSGDDPDPLLDATAEDPSYTQTFTLTDPGDGENALASFDVVRQRKLGGSVTLKDSADALIMGVAQTETVITVDVTGLTPDDVLEGDNSQSLMYQWYRDGEPIDGASSITYTPKEEGVYWCVVTGSGLYRGSVASQAVTVAGDSSTVPSAPTVSDQTAQITASSITLDNAGDGYQYSIDGGATWQKTPTFSGLGRNTEYSFVQRKSEDGPVSASASFSTLLGKPSPDDLKIDYVNETFSLTSGVSAYADVDCTEQIAADDPNSSITGYIGKTVCLKYDDATVGNNADKVVTPVQIADRPAAPTLTEEMISASDTSLSLVGADGVTYAIFSTDETETPIASTVGDDSSIIMFNNLGSGETYVIKARKEATESAFHSYQARVEVKTSAPLARIGIAPTRTEYPYTGQAQQFEYTTVPAGITGVTVMYYRIEGDDFTEEVPDPPTAVGSYKVHLHRAAVDGFAAVDVTLDMKIVAGEQVAPAAPEAESATASSITLKAPRAPEGKTLEYACVMGANASSEGLGENAWTTSVEFTGLQPGTAYTFFARYAATEDGAYKVSPASGGTTIYTAQTAPAEGSGYIIDFARETVTAGAGYEVSVDGATWGDGPIAITPGSELFVRTAETPSGAPASAATKNTLPARPEAPSGITGGNGKISGLTAAMEYSTDGATWTKIAAEDLRDGVLSGLAAGTYQVRLAAVTGDEPAFASASVEVRVTAPSSGGITCPVTVDETANGEVDVNPSRPRPGQTVVITPEPDEGYLVDAVTVTGPGGATVEVTDRGDGTYTFTMPAGAVTVTVRFACDGGRLCPTHAYPDIDQTHWYHEAVDWAVTTGAISGYGDGTFGPMNVLTRAQMATILWRLAGEPVVEGKLPADCDSAAFYAPAVVWALETGVFSGYADGSFGPDAPLTREQAACVLYNRAVVAGEDASARADLMAYPDAGDVSAFAEEAMGWAVAEGAISGKEPTPGVKLLDPQGACTRAEMAAILMRLEAGE